MKTMETSQPFVIEGAARFEFRSEVNRRHYSISVGRPLVPSPEGGSPVLYVLDGYFYFASALEAVRVCAPQVVVVGIGYPSDAPAIRERLYDLSLPAAEEVLARDLDGSMSIGAGDIGGVNAFLKVIETEIKPRVAAMAATDSSNQAIFGHSLAGLAVLHALFTEPGAFRTFIAASPSIWWGGRAVLDGEAKFGDDVRAGTVAPRVLITMGSEEQTPDPKYAARFGVRLEDHTAHVRRLRMVDNARELTERLKALCRPGGLEVEEYAVFSRQHHNVAAWPALGRAISFAFPP
jgi:uncharacterized protein